MNDLQTLRDVWPKPDDRPRARQVARDRLIETAAGQGPAHRRPVRKITIGIVAAAAAAAGVIVAVSAGGAPSTARAPSKLAVDPAPGTVTGTPAQRILLTAAESAIKAPGGTGTYWLIERGGGGAQYVVGGAGGAYAIGDRSQTKLWYKIDGGHTAIYEQEQRSYYGPEGAAGVAAWKKVGSPTHWTVGGQRLSAEPHGWNPVQRTYQGGPFAFPNGTLDELRQLPTDPAQLRSYVLSHPSSGDTRQTDGYSEAGWLFMVASDLLSSEPVSPQVRAAAYKMLAGVPGIRSIGTVIDEYGRRGTALVSPDRAAGGAQKELLIVDPATGHMLADEWVSTTSMPLQGGQAPAGTPMKGFIPLESTWTNQPPPGI